jgi:hypothetical protein
VFDCADVDCNIIVYNDPSNIFVPINFKRIVSMLPAIIIKRKDNNIMDYAKDNDSSKSGQAQLISWQPP